MTAARKVLEAEAQAILAAAARLEPALSAAVEALLAKAGKKAIVTGIGKSGHVARQLASTLQSTGSPAVFLHPSEAAHGDLGLCQPGDPVLLISKSGSTPELIQLARGLHEFGGAFIGILGNVSSPLAREMDVVLDASVQREADPEGFLPSASSAVALALPSPSILSGL